MIIIVLVVLILFLYKNRTELFTTNSVRYVTISKEENNSFISYSNILFANDQGIYIKPHQLIVNPYLSFGNGINPKEKNGIKLLLETGIDNSPYVEYDFGDNIKLSKIIIINTKYLINAKIKVLNIKKETTFEHMITDNKEIYDLVIKP